ncbi:MAG: secretion protein HlyD, partial [Planctomycetaceae bacterium]
HVGESIKAGKTLCILADYQELHIAGRAFEHDAKAIVDVANARPRRTVTAMTDAADGTQKEITGLSIVHIENQIDVVSRALHFHAALPNRIVSNIERGGRRYVTWKYRPGQRMQLRVPVEIFNNVIVLPVDAVAQEGPEFYVFVENGKEFKKQPVAVKYRDQFEVVIEHDGSIFPPQRIALNGAHQLLMAIKNQAGGGADPHAGHNH